MKHVARNHVLELANAAVCGARRGSRLQHERVEIVFAEWVSHLGVVIQGDGREAFEAARLPYFNPHSFRKTLAVFGERTCRTPEEFKAWSQNLGHEQVMTTFSSYGSVPAGRQAEIIRGLAQPTVNNDQLVSLVQQLVQVTRRR